MRRWPDSGHIQDEVKMVGERSRKAGVIPVARVRGKAIFR